MLQTRKEIIKELRNEILFLQSGSHPIKDTAVNIELGPINAAFADKSLPLGTIHEFLTSRPQTTAATGGFISAILSSIMPVNGAVLWIRQKPGVFPAGLASFGIDPDKIIFIYLRQPKQLLWCVEEALKSNALSAVVAELPGLDFNSSRRLQLAAANHSTTCFIQHPPVSTPTICGARWKITPLPSGHADDLPGVGFPRWNVELLKVRGGQTGVWQVEWDGKTLRNIAKQSFITAHEQKRAV